MVISQAGIECIVIPGNDVENVNRLKNTMLMLNVLTEKSPWLSDDVECVRPLWTINGKCWALT